MAPAVIRLISALGNDLAKSPRLTPTSTPPPNRPSPMAPSHQSLKPKAQVSLQSSLLRSPLSTRQQEAQRLFWCPPHLTHPLHMASPWPPPATSVVFLILTAPCLSTQKQPSKRCAELGAHTGVPTHTPHTSHARAHVHAGTCAGTQAHMRTHGYRLHLLHACITVCVCTHARMPARTHRTHHLPPETAQGPPVTRSPFLAERSLLGYAEAPATW